MNPEIPSSPEATENYIMQANLVTALLLAVETLRKREAHLGEDYRSCLRAGLEDVLDGYVAGDPIVIRY
jgi:hypothetical protein